MRLSNTSDKKRSDWHDVARSASTTERFARPERLGVIVYRVLEVIWMNKLLDKLVSALAVAVLPRLVEQLVKMAEEVFNVDIDKDGVVGFEKKGGE